MNASIKRIGPEPPDIKRDYKKRPRQVDGWGKYIKVLPSEYKPKKPPIPQRMPKKKEVPKRVCAHYTCEELPRQEWTEEKVDEVLRLYREGLPFAEIGEKMGCSKHAAYMVVYKVRKEGRTVYRHSPQWTKAQVDKLVEMYNNNYVLAEIAEAVGKPQTTVHSKIGKLIESGRMEPRKDKRCKRQLE